MWPKPMVVQAARGVLAVTMVAILSNCQTSGPTSEHANPTHSEPVARSDFGLVVGEVGRCGVPPGMTRPPAHPAGTVVVFRGSSAWIPAPGGGSMLSLPTEAVASAWVPGAVEYQFSLLPGPYVLGVWYGAATTSPQSPQVYPYANVSVVAGRTIRQDVPDPHICLR